MRAIVIPAVLAAGIACAPLAHAETGDRADAEQAVRMIYNDVQARCTPSLRPSFQAITWENFYPGVGGQGRIQDANPTLGGPFRVLFTNPRVGPAQDNAVGRAYGQWNVNLEFC